ncbi:hypothetical protein KC872_05305, partial [Candidatus Kaiserbacteria bacterium]|nr:hypothetical protein [Candidatus Kaiserbacteria bacterium]
EYRAEMANTYGVFVSDADAQIQLLRLVRSMFPNVITTTGMREPVAGDGVCRPCAGSPDEVGASITPTSGQDN